jgi:hypothetical protein
MVIANKIQKYIQELPEPLQEEAFDFIEYLWIKSRNKAARQEDQNWSHLSLISAMRGMEDEDTPIYTISDVKVVF